jgi:hypothetical protein
MQRSWQERVSEISTEELTELIKSVSPDSDTYFAKKFLLRMLENKGLRTTLGFINKSTDIIRDYGGLDLDSFDEDERKLFWKTSLRYYRPDEFSEVFGWAIPGAFYFAVDGVIKGFLVASKIYNGQYEDIPADLSIESFYNNLKEFGDPPVNLLIGTALFRAGLKYRKHIALEHLKDTINELRKEIPNLLAEKDKGQQPQL